MSDLTIWESWVYKYVQSYPGCTARDVAREVFNGTGDTRTKERGRAYTTLRRLERLNLIYRRRDRHRKPGDNTADRWYLPEESYGEKQ